MKVRIWASRLRRVKRREKTYDSVKFGSLVSLGAASRVFGFASAELSKVFCGFRHNVFEKLKGDAAEGFTFFHVC